ncbi:MAG TPA: hypothetical protein VFI47_28475 [Acidimicrobiales bacterium]|nr:hypothetical protein [Acidimicrobiales bacterium]
MTDIDYVAPLDGAVRVDFDYPAAARALDVIRTADGALGDHALYLAAVKEATGEGWAGVHRGEFERAHGLLERSFTGAADGLATLRVTILRAIRSANDEQALHNRRRADEVATAAGLPPPRV